MKLAVLFSGGKDSTLALAKAREHGHDITCLISLFSENKHSYMFQTANITMTKLQAEALEIPLIEKTTQGEKEEELIDLKHAIKEAKEKYQIDGIVTGAVRSTYQASRIQKICHGLDLWCFNPLWLKDQVELLKEILERKFQVIISGIFAYPLDKEWLGKQIDYNTIEKLEHLSKEIQLNPAGEGGEIETTVLNTPFFKKKITIKKTEIDYKNNAGFYNITEAELQ